MNLVGKPQEIRDLHSSKRNCWHDPIGSAFLGKGWIQARKPSSEKKIKINLKPEDFKSVTWSKEELLGYGNVDLGYLGTGKILEEVGRSRKEPGLALQGKKKSLETKPLPGTESS